MFRQRKKVYLSGTCVVKSDTITRTISARQIFVQCKVESGMNIFTNESEKGAEQYLENELTFTVGTISVCGKRNFWEEYMEQLQAYLSFLVKVWTFWDMLTLPEVLCVLWLSLWDRDKID